MEKLLGRQSEKLTMEAKEVAEILGVGTNTMYQLMHVNGFPKIKVGKKYLVVKSKPYESLEKNIGCEF